MNRMQKRSLGMLVVAGGIALAAVATAIAAIQFEPARRAAPALTARSPERAPPADLNGNGIPDWQEVLAASSAGDGSGALYIAPASLPSTEALARELFASYAASREGGELDQEAIEAALEEVVNRRGSVASAPKVYALTALSIAPGGSLSSYDGALLSALTGAGAVTEYELTTFSRVLKGSADDAERLRVASDVYRAIAEKLATLTVPSAIATNHLAAVNGLSALSAATRDLARWNGDPMDALTLVNTFVAADRAFSDSLSGLMTRLRALKNQS